MVFVPRTRPPYPEEFRREALEWLRAGRSPREVADSLGVSEQTLRNWRRQDQLDRRERDDGLTSDERRELAASCARRSVAWSRSAICSSEPRPSSPGRPRPGDRLPDDLGGEGRGGRAPSASPVPQDDAALHAGCRVNGSENLRNLSGGRRMAIRGLATISSHLFAVFGRSGHGSSHHSSTHRIRG